MYKYLVRYAFKHLNSELRPADQMWGYAVTTIETDKEPSTAEEYKEIAKQLFQTKKNCEEIRIIDVVDASTLPLNFEENIDRFVPGGSIG